jgi:dolichol kinase
VTAPGAAGHGRAEGLALRRELARKAIHLLSAAAPLLYATGVLPRRYLVWLLAWLLALAVVVELGRARVAAARGVFDRWVGMLLRPHERDRWAGATWLLAAFLGVVLLLPAPLAIAAMWAVAVGDACAAIVGRAFGRVRPGGGGKSLEGALACFAATYVGALAVARLTAVEAGVAALAATLAEWPSRPADDNVRIALAVGGALTLWQRVIS